MSDTENLYIVSMRRYSSSIGGTHKCSICLVFWNGRFKSSSNVISPAEGHLACNTHLKIYTCRVWQTAHLETKAEWARWHCHMAHYSTSKLVQENLSPAYNRVVLALKIVTADINLFLLKECLIIIKSILWSHAVRGGMALAAIEWILMPL